MWLRDMFEIEFSIRLNPYATEASIVAVRRGNTSSFSQQSYLNVENYSTSSFVTLVTWKCDCIDVLQFHNFDACCALHQIAQIPSQSMTSTLGTVAVPSPTYAPFRMLYMQPR